MVLGQEGKAAYFSVVHAVRIGSMRCTPQVCYKLADDMRGAVGKLAEDGKATVYVEEVRFISGVAMPMAKHGAALPSALPPVKPGEDRVVVNHGAGTVRRKKRGREFS